MYAYIKKTGKVAWGLARQLKGEMGLFSRPGKIKKRPNCPSLKILLCSVLTLKTLTEQADNKMMKFNKLVLGLCKFVATLCQS